MSALPNSDLDADQVVCLLGLEPHPEGGYYRETFRDAAPDSERGFSTAIYFLLRQGQISRWHRVDAAEVWHWHCGSPLLLDVVGGDGERISHILGIDLAAGQRPQAVVPPEAWQRARSLGDWTLVGCTVAPAFKFERFEIAPFGFEP